MDALSFLTANPAAAALRETYTAFHERRAQLGLPNPGTVENVAREVQKDVLLTNFAFTGLRADVTKVFGMDPLFRMSHAFTIGSQSSNLPPYAFASMFGTSKAFLQGNIGSDGALAGVFNYRWSPSFVTKANAQIMGGGAAGAGGGLGMAQGVMQIDNDYTGKDFTLSLKALNPSFLEGVPTGIYIAHYLQAVTPRLALGLEAMYQRQMAGARPDTAVSYCLRYKADDWLVAAQLQAQGALNASFWRRLSDKVEVGADMTLQVAPAAAGPGGAMMGLKKDGTTAVGAKYEFRASTFRAQVDSAGKLGVLLEKRIAPPIMLSFSGELDQVKQTTKMGLAVSFEMATDDLMTAQESGEMPSMANPPF
ncbi:translocase of outer mitochondrial membrane [Ascosphaera acerosa]|nr:translocase of outer mitochondrial membrane [Ascosphaera acerosa]